MKKIGKTILIILLGLMLVGIGYSLGGRFFYRSKRRIHGRNFIDRAYNKIMSAAESIEDMEDDIEDMENDLEDMKNDIKSWGDDMDEYFGDEYKKAGTISLDGIKNFFLKTEVGEVKIEISDRADEASYKIKRINPKYFDVKKKETQSVLKTTFLQSFLRIWVLILKTIRLKYISACRGISYLIILK